LALPLDPKTKTHNTLSGTLNISNKKLNGGKNTISHDSTIARTSIRVGKKDRTFSLYFEDSSTVFHPDLDV
jgi:hypothetical protein